MRFGRAETFPGKYGSSMANVHDKKWVEEQDIQYIHKKAKKELETLSGNSVLLIGAGGFLGLYFVKTILAWNNETNGKKIRLTALSSFRNGIPSWLSVLQKKSNLKVQKRDITKYAIPKNANYDYLIHAASIASPTFYRQYPIETINANVQGLYRILDYLIAKKNTAQPGKGLLYFSSSEIYGDPTEGNIPTPEDYRGNVSCTGPRACYDESKRFCETLCVNYAHVYDLPIRMARPFNNYGPGMKITDGRVIADFSNNILENKDIVMFSDGSPSRTFCYVADAIAGYLKILVRGRIAEAYNIGVENPEISIKDLAIKMTSLAKKHLNYKGQAIMKQSEDRDYLKDNPQRRCPIIKKAEEELDYDPEITLDQGLLRTMIWYRGEV